MEDFASKEELEALSKAELEELEELAQDPGAKPKKKSSRRMTLEQFRNLGNAEDPAAESV